MIKRSNRFTSFERTENGNGEVPYCWNLENLSIFSLFSPGFCPNEMRGKG